MYKKFFLFLEQRRIINIILLILFYLLVVLPHEKVGIIISGVFENTTRFRYDLTILLLFLLMVIFLFISIYKNIRVHPKKNRILICAIVQFVLIWATYYYLMIVNIELIHIIQYALFALIAYPIIKNTTATIILTTLFGAVDEAYQYFYLAPQRTNYYDLNDVLINLIGGATGILLIYILYPKSINLKNLKQSKWVLLLVAVIVLCIVVLINSGLIWVYPNENSVPLYTLVRVYEPNFWTLIHPQIVYHIVKPLEGLIWVGLLWTYYHFALKLKFKNYDS